ncbi:MAG: hypothetical protein J3R72DRAFT_75587 [Linnemannia gamsii]|nr:MAG: hypothetical protein J3R72DRAFT_75587 [Linnemannia gamsii]
MTQLGSSPSPTRTSPRRQAIPATETQTRTQTQALEPPRAQTDLESGATHIHNHQHQHQHQHTHCHTTPAPSDGLAYITETFNRATNLSSSPPSFHSSKTPGKGFHPCCGITDMNEPCQRNGDRVVYHDSSSTAIQRYCYQHDPTLVAVRRCLGFVEKKNRRCKITCSDSEIRPDGRPICNSHNRPNAKLVPH